MKSYTKSTLISYAALFSVCIWPFLNILNQNKLSLYNVSSILWQTCIILLFTIIVCSLSYLISLKFKISQIRLNILLIIALIFSFSYSNLATTLGVKFFPHTVFTYKISFNVCWILLLFGVCFLVWRNSKSKLLQQVLLFVSFALPFIPITQVFSYYIKQAFVSEGNKIFSQNEAEQFIFQHHNNVYFLMLDAYARHDILKQQLNFQNQNFLDKLVEKGFFVANKSVSNYHFTRASLSSMFNMDYHKNTQLGVEEQKFTIPFQGRNRLIDAFRANGYKYIAAPSGIWSQIDCSGVEDLCIKPYINLELINLVLELTPFKRILDRFRGHFYTDFDDLEKAIIAFPNQPKFIFAHFAQIHDGIYDADCNFKNGAGHPILCCPDRTKDYTNSINCFNNKLLLFIDKVLAVDPNAIIILQADHGPTIVAENDPSACEFWTKNYGSLQINSRKEYENLYGVLSAMRIPASLNKQQLLYDSISPVNIFRAVFAYLQEKNPSYIEDKSYLLFNDQANNGYLVTKNLSEFRNSEIRKKE